MQELPYIVASPPKMDDDSLQILWTLLRPGYVVALFVAGWGVNVAVFGRSKIEYGTVLGLAKDEVVSPYRIWGIAAGLCMLLYSLHMLCLATALSAGLWCILLCYSIMFAALFVWLPPPLARYFHWRVPLAKALWRCIVPDETREVPFVEVLVADGLTSMAKVFFDLSLGVCVAASSADDAWGSVFGKGSANVLHLPELPNLLGGSLQECKKSGTPFFFLALPFLIRARQCIVSAKNAPDNVTRDLHRVNLMKYLSALPVVLFSFAHARSGPHQSSWLVFIPEDFEAMWAMSAVINSIFSFMWDLVMDWGLLQPSDKQSNNFGLRPVLLFRGIWGFYHMAITFNLMGRTLWSLRWSPQATAFLGTFFLGTFQQFAEVIRRCLWNVIRVEWECIKKNVHRVDKHFPV
mmetsp:Transcript_2632/g.7583  ORF Transcript_2632/g.7583 Transcript_2632/m.7583 type:complete len:406 (+) Transcript_2632:84-1301(+)